MEILDAYVLTEPSAQNALDVFDGEWSSQLPERFGLTTNPGSTPLFEDPRVEWAEQVLGDFADWDILELGPLEGGHSFMFQERGARAITAIEANTRAYLKCLCVKEVLGLDRVRFRLGDFMRFLEDGPGTYDMVFASGVLYHMEEPLRLLELMSGVSDRLFVWTHYYEPEVIAGNEELKVKFGPVEELEFQGATYECSTQSYGAALDWSGFCGGPEPVSRWLTRASLMSALDRLGYTDVQVSFEQLDHPHGPALAVCALR